MTKQALPQASSSPAETTPRPQASAPGIASLGLLLVGRWDALPQWPFSPVEAANTGPTILAKIRFATCQSSYRIVSFTSITQETAAIQCVYLRC